MIVLDSGIKASPEKLEELLENISGIQEALVYGKTIDSGQVEIIAKIWPTALSSEVSASEFLTEIRDMINQQLPISTQVARCELSCAAFPKTASGKKIRG